MFALAEDNKVDEDEADNGQQRQQHDKSYPDLPTNRMDTITGKYRNIM